MRKELDIDLVTIAADKIRNLLRYNLTEWTFESEKITMRIGASKKYAPSAAMVTRSISSTKKKFSSLSQRSLNSL